MSEKNQTPESTRERIINLVSRKAKVLSKVSTAVPTEFAQNPKLQLSMIHAVENKKNQARINYIKPGIVQSLTFRIASPEEIRGKNRAKISEPRISNDTGCVQDLDMGPSSVDVECRKCPKDIVHCPGHPGYIELAVPVFNPGYYKVIKYLMYLFCFNHFSVSYDKRMEFLRNYSSAKKGILLNEMEKLAESDPECPKIEIIALFNVETARTNWTNIRGPEKITLIKKVLSTKCEREEKIVNYRLNKTGQMVEVFDKETMILDPERILKFFTAIDNDDTPWNEILGFGSNKFAHMIFKAFPVLANVWRPTRNDEKGEMHSELTQSYYRIVSFNQKLDILKQGQKSDSSGHRIVLYETSYYTDLNIQINDLFFGNDTNNIDQSRKAGQKSYNLYINGKKGIFRHDIMGKGADFSGRTVIIGDPGIDVDEVGMSDVMSSTVTTEEFIEDESDLVKWISFLPDFDNKPPVPKPGTILAVTKPNGKYIHLTTNNFNLEIGDRIHRTLIDDDPVTISRQPVLHKGGFMGFRLKIIKNGGNVIRIHPSVTSPFNADFDGDEMNFAIPQRQGAKADTLNKLFVTKCARGDQYSSPWIGLIQNAVFAAHNLTMNETMVDEELISRMVSEATQYFEKRNPNNIFRTNAKEFRDLLKEYRYPINPLSGRAAFSIFLPKDFNYKRSVSGGDPIEVVDGILISGTLTKNDVGKSSKGMVDGVIEKYGADAAVVFLSALTRGMYTFIESYGGTISKDDVVFKKDETKDPQETVDKLLEDAYEESVKLYKESETSGVLSKLTETKVQNILASVGDRINDIVKSGGVDVIRIKSQLTNEKTNLNNAKSNLDDIFNFVIYLLKQNVDLDFDSDFFELSIEMKYIENTRESVIAFLEWLRDTILKKSVKDRTKPVNVLKEIEILRIMGHLLTIAESRHFESYKAFQTLEYNINKAEKTRDSMKKFIQNMINIRTELVGANKYTNRFLSMVYSGAKGTPVNVLQVMGLIGQQQKDLIQINPATNRSLPMFERGEMHPAATGFCGSSYSKGMNVSEFFHHAQASRGNVIVSNLKPSQTGYFYRREWIMMTDILIFPDGSVRDEIGRVVQFAYGNDMFDPRRLINVFSGEPPEFINIAMEVLNLK